jgi:hypothetical protein
MFRKAPGIGKKFYLLTIEENHDLNQIYISFYCRVSSSDQPNIYGRTLEICSTSPLTGWFRDGYCRTDHNDRGVHVVCATMTQEVII